MFRRPKWTETCHYWSCSVKQSHVSAHLGKGKRKPLDIAAAHLSMVAFSESMGSVSRSSRLSLLSSSASVETFLSSIRSTTPGMVAHSEMRGRRNVPCSRSQGFTGVWYIRFFLNLSLDFYTYKEKNKEREVSGTKMFYEDFRFFF